MYGITDSSQNLRLDSTHLRNITNNIAVHDCVALDDGDADDDDDDDDEEEEEKEEDDDDDNDDDDDADRLDMLHLGLVGLQGELIVSLCDLQSEVNSEVPNLFSTFFVLY